MWWFILGFIAAHLVGAAVRRWKRRNMSAAVTPPEPKALSYARTMLQVITERDYLEPMAAKISLKAERNIREMMGEEDPLDAVIRDLKGEG